MHEAPSLEQLKNAVPARPTLAPGVRLAGQMQESAFVDPPWLLEREGEGFIQVTRLLYRVTEQADGQHSLDDIARAVGEAEGRKISTDNVRQLIATQLILKGLAPAANGQVIPRPRASRSALAIARMKMIDPAFLAGITGALQMLYWPGVLAVVLGVAALAEGWLYLVHGVGASLHDAFYVPGFMLLVLVVTVLSAGFHELGHAAALRYSGGKVRAMGFGMYLMYPAFFTDVSDNYRLPRWSRVRTDLGGFYFNLIFALGIFALYVMTRQEVLLVIVVLMNFEIIHQLLPFVRLDGYWTLADVTGIPDFFSRMGAFLRGILRINREGAARGLPELKWWGKVVFLGYILVTVPGLAFLSFLMMRSVPRVLSTAWDALGQQWQGFQQAQLTANVLGMLGAGGQAVLIVLPVAGLAFSLYRVGTGLGGLLWRWSAGSPGRRALSICATAAVVALLYLLWAPQIQFLDNRPSPLYAADTYRPIGRAERLTLGDALAGVAVAPPPVVEPSGGGRSAPATNAGPVASPTANAPATPTVETIATPRPSETARPTGTATAQPVATRAGVGSAGGTGATGTGPTTVPTVGCTPRTPLPTGTPSSGASATRVPSVC